MGKPRTIEATGAEASQTSSECKALWKEPQKTRIYMGLYGGSILGSVDTATPSLGLGKLELAMHSVDNPRSQDFGLARRHVMPSYLG